jgi:hypothetical protein
MPSVMAHRLACALALCMLAGCGAEVAGTAGAVGALQAEQAPAPALRRLRPRQAGRL